MARIVEESYIADLKKWAEGKFEESENGMGYALLEVAVDLENMPSVVRCKDCTHWCDTWVAPDGKHEHGYCHLEESDDVVVGRWDDDFCSYGERKDNERKAD